MDRLRVMVATEDGTLYIYNMDGSEGGDLTLYKQHCVDGRVDDSKDRPDGGESSGIDGETARNLGKHMLRLPINKSIHIFSCSLLFDVAGFWTDFICFCSMERKRESMVYVANLKF